jgi:hypothetical protein
MIKAVGVGGPIQREEKHGSAPRKPVNVPSGSCEEIDFWEKTSGYFGKFCD